MGNSHSNTHFVTPQDQQHAAESIANYIRDTPGDYFNTRNLFLHVRNELRANAAVPNDSTLLVQINAALNNRHVPVFLLNRISRQQLNLFLGMYGFGPVAPAAPAAAPPAAAAAAAPVPPPVAQPAVAVRPRRINAWLQALLGDFSRLQFTSAQGPNNTRNAAANDLLAFQQQTPAATLANQQTRAGAFQVYFSNRLSRGRQTSVPRYGTLIQLLNEYDRAYNMSTQEYRQLMHFQNIQVRLTNLRGQTGLR